MLVLAPNDRVIGLELADAAVDGCDTKVPCGGAWTGRSPEDRGQQGLNRSTLTIVIVANRHDAPLFGPTFAGPDALAPPPAGDRVHLQRDHD